MSESGVVVSIDYWHTKVAVAARTSAGGVVVVPIDGVAVSSASVAVDDQAVVHAGRDAEGLAAREPASLVRLVGSRLLEDQIAVGPASVGPEALIAATMSRVATEVTSAIGQPDEVVISVPAAWVARQRRRAVEAAQRAGLVNVRVAVGAESILREQMADGDVLPDESVAVVCRLDETVGEVVVLRRAGDAYVVEAGVDVGELGEMPGSTLPEQAAAALSRVLDPEWIVEAAYYQAAGELADGLVAELAGVLGLSVQTVHVSDLAAAFGAARRVEPVDDQPHATRPWGRIATSALAAVVAFASTAVLVSEVLNASLVVEATSVSPPFLATEWYGWGLAAVLATLGMLAAAIAVVQASNPRRPRPGPDSAFGSALLVAAASGTGIAVVIALMGAAYFVITPTSILESSLWSVAPLAVVLAVLGAMVARTGMPPAADGQRRAWRDVVRFPVLATILASFATVALVTTCLYDAPPGDGLWWTLQHLGAYGIGWAMACFVVADPWRRLIAGFLFSTPAVYVISVRTADVIMVCLIIGITLSWLVRLSPFILSAQHRAAGRAKRAG